MNPDFPAGTVTFLFTDLEGSTGLWEQYPEAMQSIMARHDALLREAVESCQGIIVKTTGDGLHAVFAAASDGAAAAIAAQRLLAAEIWPLAGPLKVRLALHTGEGELRENDYFGLALNRAARLMDSGHGWQVLLSRTTAGLIRDHLPPGTGLVDLGEHVLRDLVRPVHVFQLDYPGAPEGYPPLKSLAAYANNLPSELSSFIGRSEELAEAKRLLTQSRLLTLTGIGGTGKTRLMLRAGADMLDQFPNGVWLVELAAVTDPEMVIGQIAKTLGVQEQADRPLHETLENFLRLKELLLLLDNCEHLLEACASTAQQLLQTCPGLKILATSREGLAIAGEVTYQVPSLSLPDRNGPVSPEQMTRSEAAQLFLARAQASTPAFQLTAANAPFIAQICRRLDGIPLAIELAAARVKALSTKAIAARLDNRFRLLTGGSRTALPRQQTLQALIDWSWNLLSGPEQRLLRRLSVFAGGWTLEAAEAVAVDPDAAVGGHNGLDIVDSLAQLVDKSLVVVERRGAGDVRYSLLETIRQYARIKLLDAAETEPVRDRHTHYYINQVIQAEPSLKGPEMMAWISKLKIEFSNLQAAMAWSQDRHLDLALQLAGSLLFLLLSRGMISISTDFRPWLKSLITTTETQPGQSAEPDKDLAIALSKAYSALSSIHTMHGDYLKGQLAAEKAVASARQGHDLEALAYALGVNALAIALKGDLEDSVRKADEAIKLVRPLDKDWSYGWILVIATPNFGFAGDPRARALVEEVNRIAIKTGNPLLTAFARFGQSNYALSDGQIEQALSKYKESLEYFQEIGDRVFTTIIRSNIAHIYRQLEKYQDARAIYRKSILAWQELGHRAAVAHQLECFAYLGMVNGENERAATLLGAAVSLRVSTNSPRRGPEQEEYDDAVVALKARLGEDLFKRAAARGRGMSMEEAIGFALNQIG